MSQASAIQEDDDEHGSQPSQTAGDSKTSECHDMDKVSTTEHILDDVQPRVEVMRNTQTRQLSVRITWPKAEQRFKLPHDFANKSSETKS